VPTIPTRTAPGAGGTLNLPGVSPDSFGAQGFQGVTQLGQTIAAVDAKLQAQRDEVDLIGKAGDYNVRLAQLPAEVWADPHLTTSDERVAVYKEKADEFRQQLNKDASPGVVRALSIHAAQALSTGIVHLQTEDRARQIQQLRADSTAMQDRLSEREAGQIASGNGEAALVTRNERMALLARSVQRGIHNPQEAVIEAARAQNQTWESVAQQNPDYIMQIQEDVLKGGTPPAGMDPQKLHVYTSLAIGTMHASQMRTDLDLKRQEAQVKAIQQQNANLLTADVLEGKQVTDRIPSLLRARGLDDGVARTLAELETKMATAPDMTKYQKGLASQIEATLGAMKYETAGLQEGLEQGIQSDFLQGHIMKEEFTHLMGVLRGVEDYKHQAGKEDHNQDVTHAHANMIEDLQTTGPADKFDALSKQTMKDADQFFWRKMGQNPNADPWAVSKEAGTIFKPVIEKRLGLSKQDKAALDDARITGMVHTKTISAAGAKALREKTQHEEGNRIVQEALKNLPPPPEPGFFERLQKKFMPQKKQETPKARKSPGVMGGD
jgi:hypothetical protein